MEGVEDIPGAALSDGIRWDWETYPEFLDAVSSRRLALDVGSLIPHGAVRAYVMGERGARNEPSTWFQVQRANAQQVWVINNRQWFATEGACDTLAVAE